MESTSRTDQTQPIPKLQVSLSVCRTNSAQIEGQTVSELQSNAEAAYWNLYVTDPCTYDQNKPSGLDVRMNTDYNGNSECIAQRNQSKAPIPTRRFE